MRPVADRPQTPVAVVGMAAVMPGAEGLDAYWRALRDGVDAITEVPADRFDPEFHGAAAAGSDELGRTHCRRGGFLTAPPTLDAARFGIVPSTATAADPDQLIALGVAADAVDDAGGADRLGDPDRIGVVLGRGGYLGAGLARYSQRVRGLGDVVRAVTSLVPQVDAAALREALTTELPALDPDAAIGLVPNLVASRIANRLDLRGPAYTVDAACASSLIAVDRGVADLISGRCDAVLAGGVHHCHDATLWSVFTQLGALSPSGRVRPFARDADGLLVGEGTGVVVLKRLDDALRDGDRVYAVVRGVGTSSDGRTGSLVAPDPEGQAAAVRAAWTAAGRDPVVRGGLGLLEAHGTGTAAGDAAEIRTLRTVFGPAGPDGPDVVLGSVKSMIGHTMPAAGIAGLIKAALALHHRTLLPTLHCDDPAPELEGSRFAPIATARGWDEPAGEQDRLAGVEAFGFGGINAHVLLSEAPRPLGARSARVTTVEPETVQRLAADTVDELREHLERPDAELRRAGSPGSGRVRLAVVGADARRLAAARTVVARRDDQGRPERWNGRRDIWFSPEPLVAPGGSRPVFVFPGLGARFDPRLDDVAQRLGVPPVAPAEVGDVGEHARALMESAALLVDALAATGVHPGAVAGHSVGEWSAMAAAGLIRTGTGSTLRSWWPSDLELPAVDFVALGTSVDHAVELIRHVGEDQLVVSHENAPRQTIVCGPPDAAAALVERAARAGVVTGVLPFRSGFHTPWFAAHHEPLRRLAATMTLHPAQVPVWSATTAAAYPSDPAAIRQLYVDHLVAPVRFRALVDALYDAGHRVFVQVGAGQLDTFIGDSLADRPHLVVSAASTTRAGLDQLARVDAALWAVGAREPAGADPPTAPRHARTPVVPVVADLTVPGMTIPARARELVAAGVGAASGSPEVPDLPPALAGEFSALMTELATSTREVAMRCSPAAPNPAPQPAAERVRISWQDMPELADHCLVRQPAEWPDPADRRSVVPGTALVELAREAAARARPGGRVAAVRDVAFRRWVPGLPAHDIEIGVRAETATTARVTLGAFASATVVYDPATAGTQPDVGDLGDPPEPGDPDLMPGSAVYTRRIMFHGPRYHAVAAVTRCSGAVVEGTLEVTSGRGALLDGVGQLLGVWLAEHDDENLVAFPVRIDEIRTVGTTPPVGTRLSCRVTVTDVDPAGVTVDAALWLDGRPWGHVRGWRDVRLAVTGRAWSALRHPDRAWLSESRPGGWVLAVDEWPGAAALEFHAGLYLNGPERAELEGVPLAGRRAWLLERVAAKDAARAAAGTTPYPAALRVRAIGDGRFVVSGHHHDHPEMDVVLDRLDDVAVALAVPRSTATAPDRPPAEIRLDHRPVGPRVRTHPIRRGSRRHVVAWTAQDHQTAHDQLGAPE